MSAAKWYLLAVLVFVIGYVLTFYVLRLPDGWYVLTAPPTGLLVYLCVVKAIES